MIRGLLGCAAVLGALYGAAHLAGLRQHTAVLSGTAGSTGLGVGYAIAYFAFVIVCPALVLAAGIHWTGERVLRRLSRPRA